MYVCIFFCVEMSKHLSSSRHLRIFKDIFDHLEAVFRQMLVFVLCWNQIKKIENIHRLKLKNRFPTPFHGWISVSIELTTTWHIFCSYWSKDIDACSTHSNNRFLIILIFQASLYQQVYVIMLPVYTLHVSTKLLCFIHSSPIISECLLI